MDKSDKKILDSLAKERWYDGRPVYDLQNDQTAQVNIRSDERVSRGNFKADPLIPGGYVAHPVTIRAMRKDIFVAGNDVDLHEMPYTCSSCGATLDLQFWKFCPYCDAPFALSGKDSKVHSK